jgi:integrase
MHSCLAGAQAQCRLSVPRAPVRREVERLIEAAKGNRWGHRDAIMVLLAFKHGLRAAELVDLRWEQVDLENAILHVRRASRALPRCIP